MLRLPKLSSILLSRRSLPNVTKTQLIPSKIVIISLLLSTATKSRLLLRYNALASAHAKKEAKSGASDAKRAGIEAEIEKQRHQDKIDREYVADEIKQVADNFFATNAQV